MSKQNYTTASKQEEERQALHQVKPKRTLPSHSQFPRQTSPPVYPFPKVGDARNLWPNWPVPFSRLLGVGKKHGGTDVGSDSDDCPFCGPASLGTWFWGLIPRAMSLNPLSRPAGAASTFVSAMGRSEAPGRVRRHIPRPGVRRRSLCRRACQRRRVASER
jgi:hypothetical protein